MTITPRHYRTIWISDVHLGTRGCKAEFLLDFLRHTESDNLYLVGDIVDGWRLRRSWYWAQSHNDVIQKVLRKARKGTKVVYIPGNHDEWLRDYTQIDGIVRYAKWLALLGDGAYNAALHLNHYFNLVRRRFGYPYWSLSAYLKARVKNAVEFVGNYADAIVAEARKHGVDGVVCGHIHHAEMRDIDGVLYCNDGDWVESCTALVEHNDGRLEILHWAALRDLDPLAARSREPEQEHDLAAADAS